MSSKLRTALLAAVVVSGCAAIPSHAFASDRSEAPPPEVLAAMAGEEEPTWVNPTAYASFPMRSTLAGIGTIVMGGGLSRIAVAIVLRRWEQLDDERVVLVDGELKSLAPPSR